jgi:hypothetical protein
LSCRRYAYRTAVRDLSVERRVFLEASRLLPKCQRCHSALGSIYNVSIILMAISRKCHDHNTSQTPGITHYGPLPPILPPYNFFSPTALISQMRTDGKRRLTCSESQDGDSHLYPFNLRTSISLSVLRHKSISHTCRSKSNSAIVPQVAAMCTYYTHHTQPAKYADSFADAQIDVHGARKQDSTKREERSTEVVAGEEGRCILGIRHRYVCCL